MTKNILKIVAIFALFLITQTIGGIGIAVTMVLKNIDAFSNATDPVAAVSTFLPTILYSNGDVVGAWLVISNVMLISLLWAFKLAGRECWWESKETFSTPLLAGIGVIFLFMLAETCLLTPFDLNDLGMEAVFDSLKHSVWGFLAICIAAPITEELVFRDGVQRLLHNCGLPNWGAILITSVSFGVVHGNPAQMVPAIFMGIILGYLYVRTGNVRLCIAAHMFNNTVAFITMSFPEADVWVKEQPLVQLIPFGILFLAIGAWLMVSQVLDNKLKDYSCK